MKKIKILLSILLLGILGTSTLVGCSANTIAKYYPATRVGYKYNVDNNLNITGMNEQLLTNSDRGFRGETYITLGANKAYPARNEDPYEYLDQKMKYDNTDIQVVQTYIYLIEFYNQDLTDQALQEMKDYFIKFNTYGKKMLLRFAYEYTSDDERGPTTDQIIRHCNQLKQWFGQNLQLVYDTVYSVQLGMIGLWGEGHGNRHPHNVRQIISAVCDMTPPKLNVMVRTKEIYKSANPKDLPRLTYHDDFVVGVGHEWSMGVSLNSRKFKKMSNLTRHTISDGELPWGEFGKDTELEHLSIDNLVKQIATYGFSTLSLEHNYMEKDDHQEFELYQARTHYLSKDFLDSNKIPYNPYMLDDNNQITAFDYLNYHLGYQLALSNYVYDGNKVSFVVNNFGIACPIGYNMQVYKNGQLILTKSAQQAGLYQFGQYKVKLNNIGADDQISIKFVSERDNKEIVFANDLATIDGRYIIK